MTPSGAPGQLLYSHQRLSKRPDVFHSYALYSSFSPGFQKYLEGLTAVHSAVAQADGSRAAGHTVRREAVETIHPVVRVHPVTGWKSIYVNPGFTRRIVGVPKAESDTILNLLFHQIRCAFPHPSRRLARVLTAPMSYLSAKTPTSRYAFAGSPTPSPSGTTGCVPSSDMLYRLTLITPCGQVVTHSATFDFWPHTRHALRATPHGERPTSVAEYEKQGKVAKDRQLEIWAQQGISGFQQNGQAKPRGYND